VAHAATGIPLPLPATTNLSHPGKGFYYTDAISDTTVKYIQEHPSDKPFFFYVAYYAAHWPLHAPEKEIDKYKGVYDIGWDSIRVMRYNRLMELGVINSAHKLSPRPMSIMAWQDEPMKDWQTRRMETYAAMIDIMDQGIGRIIDALKEKGILDNTIILYMQDNGGCAEPVLTNKLVEPLTPEQETLKPYPPDQLLPIRKPEYTREGTFIRSGRGVMAGPADTWVAYGEDWANVSNTPFRFYKSMVHEGGIKTPLIVHWPDGLKSKGSITNQVGHIIDIMPTCLEIAGVSNNVPHEGLSLVPLFSGKKLNRKYIFWEHEANRAIRVGNWKLVSRVETPMVFTASDENNWELYDLEKDPTEMINLADRYPGRVKQMALSWERTAVRTKAKPWPWGE
jgi:arylsulfatase A-like enzyme